MSDLGKAWREQMQAEASDELCAGEFEQFDFGAIGIVAIGDGDFACGFIDLPDACVGDGDAMGVVGQVSQDLFGAAKRALQIDRPVLFIEGSNALERGDSGPAQLLRQSAQAGHKLAAEEGADCRLREKVALLFWTAPLGGILAEGTGGEDAMEVRMIV